jgi:predicted anti-sigma-YlaC factor YlaD
MSCRDTIHLICWYLEGRLSPAVEAEIKNHLLKCDDCRVVQEAATTTLDREFGTYKASENRPHLRTVIQAA